MKRTVAWLLAVCMLVVMAAGCGKKEEPVKQPAASEIAQKLKDGITFEDELLQIDDTDRLAKQYEKITTGDIEEFVLFVSSSGATPEEISVFKVKEGGDANAVKKAIENRIQQQKDGFADYVPEEMPKLENSVIINQGNYYALVVAKDASKAKELFDSCFK